MTNRFFTPLILMLLISIESAILDARETAKETRVYVDMVADLFHYGHVEYLKKAKAFGDILIVGIHSDETALSYKRLPILTMNERIRSVRECRYVDEVISDAPLVVTLDWIRQHQIDIVIHGDDISQAAMNAFYRVPIELGIFRLVPYTPGISTTELIRRIVERSDLVAP